MQAITREQSVLFQKNHIVSFRLGIITWFEGKNKKANADKNTIKVFSPFWTLSLPLLILRNDIRVEEMNETPIKFLKDVIKQHSLFRPRLWPPRLQCRPREAVRKPASGHFQVNWKRTFSQLLPRLNSNSPNMCDHGTFFLHFSYCTFFT